MKNIRVALKLSIVFGFCAIALVALGAFSLIKLGEMGQHLSYVGVDERDKILAIASANTATSNVRIYEAEQVANAVPSETARAKRDMDGQLNRPMTKSVFA